MIRVHGGFANRMYRLDTHRGSFAVKELNLVERRDPYRVEDVFRFEATVTTTRAMTGHGNHQDEPVLLPACN